MTSYATRTQTSSEQNDLKKLKSKYASKLSTLKELFADWTDDDLLFVLEEADGVLEVAVDRISEGHANQWGEVKTKKSKKEAQKAKAAAAANVPPVAQPMTYQKPERIQAPKTYIDRNTKSTKAPRIPNNNNNNNYSRKPGAKPTPSSWGYGSGQQKSSTTDSTSGGGSWASIASSNNKPSHEPSNDWNASTNISNDTWEQPSWVTEDNTKENTESTTASSSTLHNNDIDKPKSWASLLKTQPKPEPEPVKKQESDWGTESNNNETTTTTTTDAWNATNDSWNTNNDEPAADERTTTTNNNDLTTSAWNATTTTTTTTTTATTVSESIEATSTPAETTENDESKTSARQLKQESPVVMPKNDVSISDVDVKFGSFNLDDDNVQEKTAVKESVTDTKVETQPQEQPTISQEQPAAAQTQAPIEPSTEQPIATSTTTTNVASANTTTPSTTTNIPQQQTQESTYAQPQVPQQQQSSVQAPPQQQQPQQQQPQQHQTQQPQQPQIQQQPQQVQAQTQQAQTQQPFGMDHLTSAYSSYLPNQPHSGMSNFGMNPMGNLPDYGVYGSEAQRAAMGYYDPSAFGNSPVTSAGSYPTRDKFGQDTSATLGTPQGQTAPGQNQGLPGQQMYPSMPYYPYYYMPSHYNAYQQSMYGQHMMNKSLYPNMYQQQTTTASKPATQSPYGANATAAATASPYALHSQLYSQPSTTGSAGIGSGSGGYDDLQQQFGLHDYQKSPYGNNVASSAGGAAGSSQQLHGFLGHHLQGQQSQQNSQPSQPSQTQSTVDSKTDVSRNATSQPHHQQQMNYFSQQQMFSYQQYPQQQYWNQ